MCVLAPRSESEVPSSSSRGVVSARGQGRPRKLRITLFQDDPHDLSEGHSSEGQGVSLSEMSMSSRGYESSMTHTVLSITQPRNRAR